MHILKREIVLLVVVESSLFLKDVEVEYMRIKTFVAFIKLSHVYCIWTTLHKSLETIMSSKGAILALYNPSPSDPNLFSNFCSLIT